MSRLGIHYRRQFFAETTDRIPARSAAAGMPRGLVGREVANAEMLTALLQHGSDESITFHIHDDADVRPLKQTLEQYLPEGKKAVVSRIQRLDRWMEQPHHRVIWEPQPTSASLAWTRSRVAPGRIAFAGVTHALCSSTALLAMRELVAAPLRHFDRLVCTSEAVAQTARTIIDHWSGVIGKSQDTDMLSLETIPLGIDCERHRRPTEEERASVRQRLDIPADADVVLFVGRLSYHAKSNPLPLFAACQRAAERTGRPLVLVLAGWFASEQTEAGFRAEAARLAPLVRLLHVDAMDPAWRDSIWAAADLFVSLADSIQETFGLTVVEAMSRGIAVIASDWNGYRESIRHGETGLLVPTAMVEGAGEAALLAMHEGMISYDQFLAAVGQTVAVSIADAGKAVEELLISRERRFELAEAGHRHANENYSWKHIIARYERMWQGQRSMMIQQPRGAAPHPRSAMRRSVSAVVPPLREMFSRYPTTWIDRTTPLAAADQPLGNLRALLESPLAGYAEPWRFETARLDRLCKRIAAAEGQAVTLGELSCPEVKPESTDDLDHSNDLLSDSVAWGLKYGLLRFDPATESNPSLVTEPLAAKECVDLTFTTTCMGRLAHLQQTLPRLVAQPGCHVVVVDYSCPDRSGDWIRQHYSPDDVTVVRVPNRTYFDRSEAKNAAIAAATSPWVCVIDADVVVADDFAEQIRRRLAPHRLLRCMSIEEGVGGTFVAAREALEAVGYHDPVFRDWGEEDFDLLDALLFIGEQLSTYPEELVTHLPHEDQLRTQFHQTSDRWISHLVNRLYRAAKWDWARITGEIPSLERRRSIYDQIGQQVRQAAAANRSTTVTVPLGKKRWHLLHATGARILTYRVDFDRDI